LQPEGKCRGKGAIPSWRNLKRALLRPGGNREGSCRLHHVKHLDAGEPPSAVLWCGWSAERWMQIESWPWWFGFPWFQGGRAAAAAAGPPLADFNGSRFDGPGKLGIFYMATRGRSRSRQRERSTPLWLSRAGARSSRILSQGHN
jgi:hypothetical protein